MLELLIIVVFLAMWVSISGGIGYAIGRSKGRPAAGFWLGLVFGFVGWIIVGLMGNSAAEEIRRAHLVQASFAGTPGQHPAPPAATIADDDTEIVYGTVDWPPESLASICAELERRNVTYTLEGDDLVVDTRHEALLDRMIADIDTGPPDTNAGGAELVAYSTVEWSTSAVDTIVDELERHGVDYTFHDGELVVAARDADRCDTIIAASRDLP